MTSRDELEKRRQSLSAEKQALLAKRLRKAVATGAIAQQIPRLPDRSEAPLSFAQERMWFLHQLDPVSAVYHCPTHLRLRGPLNVRALEQALDAIVHRHEVLRTCFPSRDGQPVGRTLPHEPLPLEQIDVSGLSLAERESAALRLAVAESCQPFDLERGPLVRTKLLRLGEEDHVLLRTLHHIVYDGWSEDVLNRELAAGYQANALGAEATLPELPVQYPDFAVWQRGRLQTETLQSQLAHWRKQLEGAPALLELPTDQPRPAVLTSRGARRTVMLVEHLAAQKLQELGRLEGATLFMTLLAGFQALLSRYSGQEDLVVGCPIAGRTHQELEGLVGLFINTLLVRADLSGSPTFRQLLARVRERTLSAYAHQELPFEKLVQELRPPRTLSYSPFFQVLFQLRNLPRSAAWPAGLDVRPFDVELRVAPFDLVLNLTETDGAISCRVDYSTDLFEAGTIDRMLGHYRVLLEAAAADPDRPVSKLPLLTGPERHQLLVELNATAADYPRDRCLHQLFEEQAVRTPNALAVVWQGGAWTYAELDRRAERLAHYLRGLGVGPDVVVAVYLERSPEVVLSLLGILKAGAAYLPLDPTHPKDRLDFILKDAATPVLLTRQHLAANLPQDCPRLVCLDTDLEATSRSDDVPPLRQALPSDLAYVIYTSGSTGEPKGVAVEHRGVVNCLFSIRRHLELGPRETFLSITTLAFDIAALEVFLPLLGGGRLALASHEEVSNGALLAARLTAEGVTVLQATPVTWQLLLKAGWSGDPCLKMLCGGETLHRDLAEQLLPRGAGLWNVYGPTETTIWSTIHRVTPGDGPVPIGRPLANTSVYVLDRNNQPVPVGVPGEVYVAGHGVARGYFQRPQLTRARFLDDPFANEPGRRTYRTGDQARWRSDGTLEFLGRFDNQVKIRGYRIELGEIEAVLARHPAVGEGVVLARNDPSGKNSLIAFVELRPAHPVPAEGELRAFLKEKLPDYMLPSAYVTLAALPRTPNGKIDRKALALREPVRPVPAGSGNLPRNDTERKLAKVWEHLLEVRSVGVTDGFFELGGHSLLAVNLFVEIEKQFGTRLPLSMLYRHATLEALAAAIEQAVRDTTACQPVAGELPWSPLVPIQPNGSRTPLFSVHGLGAEVLFLSPLARRMDPEQPFYGLEARGCTGGLEPLDDVSVMAATYLKAVREVQPAGPYNLSGFSLGGIVAYEMAQQLRSQGEDVALLAIIDASPEAGKPRKISWTAKYAIRFLRNACFWAYYDLAQNPAEVWARLRRYVAAWMPRPLRSSAKGVGGSRVEVLFDVARLPAHFRKLLESHHRALGAYKPLPYPGRLTCFRARARPLLSSHEPDLGWGKLAAGGVDLRIIPGSHDTILEEPYVRVLARELSAALAQTSRGGKAGQSTSVVMPRTRSDDASAEDLRNNNVPK